MSYDVYLTIDTGGDEPTTVVDCGNYTSNVGAMYRRAMPDGIHGIHGKAAIEAAEHLAIAIGAMEAQPDEFRALNPENGWGDYEGALAYLRRIREECQRHPKTTVELSA